MAPLNWASYLERAVGKGHPTLSDTVNRALRQLLSESGYDPDASPFPGLAGPVANVKVYGTGVGTGGDDSAAIQAAINTGLPVLFPDGTYHANNLTQSTDRQRLFALGGAQIIKNANGPLLHSTGSTVKCYNLEFRGESATPSFTGNNVEFTGPNCELINCGSRWAFGRAVKATGDGFKIRGTADIYQSYDPGGTGYDIEIGVSGTATLYHQLFGVYTSQGSGTNAGGILLTDTGSAVICGGQFGKLNIASGTSPAGVNGGMTLGCRILGDVTIGQSGAMFSGNQFGVMVLTINATITGVSIDESNSFQTGATIVNNGVVSNPITRSLLNPGGFINLKYGDDTSIAVFSINPSSGLLDTPGSVQVPSQKAFVTEQASGAVGGQLFQNNIDRLQLQNFVSGKDNMYIGAGTMAHRFFSQGGSNENAKIDESAVAGDTRLMLWDVTAGTLVRVTRGAIDSGGAGFRVLRIPN